MYLHITFQILSLYSDQNLWRMNVPVYARLETLSAKVHALQLRTVTTVILRCLSVSMLVPVEANVLPVAITVKITSVRRQC